MLGNDALDREAIARTHREATMRRMVQSGEPILLVQDTTSLNYNTPVKTEGVGYISDKTLGMNIHTCIAVTASGLVLGVLSQSPYNREQPRNGERTHESKKVRPLEEKESYRRVQTLNESTADVPIGVEAVTVCDREGAMYEFFDAAEQDGQRFLVRIAQNRMTVDNKRVLDEIRRKPCAGRVQTLIPRDSRLNLPEREVTLQIRYGSFEIRRPAILNKTKTLKGCREVNVIHAVEEAPYPQFEGKSVEPIEWFLMTNNPVESAEAEWKLLYRTANKTKKTPRKPYTIGEAINYLGQLGGPKRAPGDGPPGIKTIWIGLEKLYTLLAYREWLL